MSRRQGLAPFDFGSRIVKIIGIIFISRVLFEVVYLLVEEVLFKERNLTEIQTSRRLTLVPLIRSFLQYLVYFGAAVSILYTLDINPTPILAGAGIVGIATRFRNIGQRKTCCIA